MLVSLALLVLFLAPDSVPTPAPCAPPAISGKALALMRPVLSGYLHAQDPGLNASASLQDRERRWREFEERFYKLLATRSAAASEAVAALMCFYVGEHPAEELRCEAVTRGPKIAPYLERFRHCPPVTGLEPFDRARADIPNFREEALGLIAAKQPAPCN